MLNNLSSLMITDLLFFLNKEHNIKVIVQFPALPGLFLPSKEGKLQIWICLFVCFKQKKKAEKNVKLFSFSLPKKSVEKPLHCNFHQISSASEHRNYNQTELKEAVLCMKACICWVQSVMLPKQKRNKIIAKLDTVVTIWKALFNIKKNQSRIENWLDFSQMHVSVSNVNMIFFFKWGNKIGQWLNGKNLQDRHYYKY